MNRETSVGDKVTYFAEDGEKEATVKAVHGRKEVDLECDGVTHRNVRRGKTEGHWDFKE